MIINDSWPGGIRSMARSLWNGMRGYDRCNVFGHSQAPYEMSKLLRISLGVLSSRPHIQYRPAVLVESVKDARETPVVRYNT